MSKISWAMRAIKRQAKAKLKHNLKDLKAYAQKILDSGERLNAKTHMEGFTPEQKKELRRLHRNLKITTDRKKRYASNPELKKIENKRQRDIRHKKMEADPEYREKINEHKRKYEKERYKTDTEYRKKKNEATKKYAQKRLETDPEYRKKRNDWMREYQREQYHTNPKFRKRKIDSAKKQRDRKKAEELGEQ